MVPRCSEATALKYSIDCFKGQITGESHISREHVWFPVDFPLSQPIEIWKIHRKTVGKYAKIHRKTVGKP